MNTHYLIILDIIHPTNNLRTFAAVCVKATNLLVAVVTLPTCELQTLLLYERIVGQEIGAGRELTRFVDARVTLLATVGT